MKKTSEEIARLEKQLIEEGSFIQAPARGARRSVVWLHGSTGDNILKTFCITKKTNTSFGDTLMPSPRTWASFTLSFKGILVVC